MAQSGTQIASPVPVEERAGAITKESAHHRHSAGGRGARGDESCDKCTHVRLCCNDALATQRDVSSVNRGWLPGTDQELVPVVSQCLTCVGCNESLGPGRKQTRGLGGVSLCEATVEG